jgi:hypothetical protein
MLAMTDEWIFTTEIVSLQNAARSPKTGSQRQ